MLTRRTFAGLIGGSMLSGAGLGEMRFGRPASARERATFSPADFGAVGDGRADDTIALHRTHRAAARDGGVVIYDGVHRITRRLSLPSHVAHVGRGSDATILNDSPFDPRRPIDRECFNLGDYTVDMSNTLVGTPLEPVHHGDGVLTTPEELPANLFLPGSFAVLASRERLQTQQGARLPVRQQMVKLVAVDPAHRRFRLDRPVEIDLDEGELLRLVDYNSFSRQPAHCVENIEVRNLSFVGGGISVGAMYGCTLEDLRFHDVRDLVFGNCYAHSVVRRLSGTFWNRGFEVKFGSHDSRFEDIDMTFVPREAEPASGLFSIGEMARDLTIRDIRIKAPGYAPKRPPLAALQYCFGIDIDGLRIEAPDVTEAIGLAMVAGKAASSGLVDCRLRNIDIRGGAFLRYLQWGGFGGPVGPRYCRLEAARFRGDVGRTAAIFESGEGNLLADVTFDGGRLVSRPEFRNNEIRDVGGIGIEDRDGLERENRVGLRAPRP